MTDTIVSDLMDYRRNIDKEFSVWYGFAIEIANSIDVEPSNPPKQNAGANTEIMLTMILQNLTTKKVWQYHS